LEYNWAVTDMDNLQHVQLGAISTDYHSSVKILATAYTHSTLQTLNSVDITLKSHWPHPV